MIKPESIAFDIDGVYADIITLFIDIAKNDYNINGVRYEDITTYSIKDSLDINPSIIDEIIIKIQKGCFTPPLKPMEGASDVITKLANTCGNVLFVTARGLKLPIYNWLLEVLPLKPARIDVVAAGTPEGKTRILLDRNISHFVEDRLETCYLLQDAGIIPIIFKQPWNREKHPFIEASNWKEIESMIIL